MNAWMRARFGEFSVTAPGLCAPRQLISREIACAMASGTTSPVSFYSAASLGPLRGFMNDMAALDAKEEAQHWQSMGAFEKALPLMLESVNLREHSHTLCLSLSELAELYLDMCDFQKASETTQRMLEEAWRYDAEQQTRIANEIAQDIARGKRSGLTHGASVKISCCALPHLSGETGTLQGKVRSIDQYYIDVDSTRYVLNRHCFRLLH